MKPLFTLLLALLCVPVFLLAQEEVDNEVVVEGTRYVSLKIKRLEKYNARVERQQGHVLKKLKKKEQRFAKRLKKRDSSTYEAYASKPVTFDSIETLSKETSGPESTQEKKKFDTLKAVQSFVREQGAANGASSSNLPRLEKDIARKNYINKLIDQRTSELGKLSSNDRYTKSMKGIKKQAFYGKSRMSIFREMQEEPEIAEETAMEYLQGSKGFNRHLSKSLSGGNSDIISGAGSDPTSLQSMGFQTKSALQGNFQNRFGGSISKVSENMGGNVSKWQKKQTEAMSNVRQTKQSLSKVRKSATPDFKINPMRALPFRKRITPQYSFNTIPADKDRPVIIQLTGALCFRHTERLSYGIGAVSQVGLGKGIQQLRFSLEGAGPRAFVTHDMIYGIAVYMGYERIYALSNGARDQNEKLEKSYTVQHTSKYYSESLLLGLSKKYSINSKFSGQLQLLYDVWWQQKGLKSPIIFQMTTSKK